MKLFLSLALRNLFRQRLRTCLALAAIASGCAALIVNGGVIYNIFRELREDAIRGRHGHLQVYRQGFQEGHRQQPEGFLIPVPEADKILALARAQEGIEHATRRRHFSGMISHGDRYVAFAGLGVEPEAEVLLSRHRLLAGEGLIASEPYGVIAGKGLAERAAAEPGDLLTLMTNTSTGALNAIDARLLGIFEGGLKEYDDWTLKVPLSLAEELLLDDRTERIVLLARATEEVAGLDSLLAERFAEEELALEIASWKDLALFHNQVVDLFGRELDVIQLIIATIVILGIGNILGMAILERRVELATLRALGIGRRQIATLLTVEACFLGLLGAILGVLTGVLLAWVITAIGIPFPSPPGSTRPFQGGVDLIPATMWMAFLLSLLATLAAAAFPIWRALRWPIAEGMRS